jgi:hypothetical protein
MNNKEIQTNVEVKDMPEIHVVFYIIDNAIHTCCVFFPKVFRFGILHVYNY